MKDDINIYKIQCSGYSNIYIAIIIMAFVNKGMDFCPTCVEKGESRTLIFRDKHIMNKALSVAWFNKTSPISHCSVLENCSDLDDEKTNSYLTYSKENNIFVTKLTIKNISTYDAVHWKLQYLGPARSVDSKVLYDCRLTICGVSTHLLSATVDLNRTYTDNGKIVTTTDTIVKTALNTSDNQYWIQLVVAFMAIPIIITVIVVCCYYGCFKTRC